jgi:hypothetical protein
LIIETRYRENNANASTSYPKEGRNHCELTSPRFISDSSVQCDSIRPVNLSSDPTSFSVWEGCLLKLRSIHSAMLNKLFQD